MKKIKSFALTLIIFLVLPLTACNMDTPDLVKKTKYGIVEVMCFSQIGSGFITSVSEEGSIIITNYHIIKDYLTSFKEGRSIDVRFYDSVNFVPAELLGYSKDYDIAVLKTQSKPQKSYIFKFSSEPKVGETAVSLGFIDFKISAYQGIVTCKNKLIDTGNDFKSLYLTEVSAPAPLGSSGGVTVNKKGKIIGLNAFNLSYEDTIAGISYKVPVSIVKAVYNRIISAQKDGIYQPSLGFDILPKGEILITCLNQVKVSYEYGALKVVSSSDEKLIEGKEITYINGKKASLMNLLSEIITTLDKTEFIQSE